MNLRCLIRDQQIVTRGNDMASTVVKPDKITDKTRKSRVKSVIVFALMWIFEYSPSIAMILSQLVLFCWPGFKER